ncbi:hypothetical protein B0H11DRAFT_2403768 [Mycena galericulata]|nr:hypothetical protein B0H11DRAFT_2403768 [Mycena galericulata]
MSNGLKSKTNLFQRVNISKEFRFCEDTEELTLKYRLFRGFCSLTFIRPDASDARPYDPKKPNLNTPSDAQRPAFSATGMGIQERGFSLAAFATDDSTSNLLLFMNRVKIYDQSTIFVENRLYLLLSRVWRLKTMPETQKDTTGAVFFEFGPLTTHTGTHGLGAGVLNDSLRRQGGLLRAALRARIEDDAACDVDPAGFDCQWARNANLRTRKSGFGRGRPCRRVGPRIVERAQSGIEGNRSGASAGSWTRFRNGGQVGDVEMGLGHNIQTECTRTYASDSFHWRIVCRRPRRGASKVLRQCKIADDGAPGRGGRRGGCWGGGLHRLKAANEKRSITSDASCEAWNVSKRLHTMSLSAPWRTWKPYWVTDEGTKRNRGVPNIGPGKNRAGFAKHFDELSVYRWGRQRVGRRKHNEFKKIAAQLRREARFRFGICNPQYQVPFEHIFLHAIPDSTRGNFNPRLNFGCAGPTPSNPAPRKSKTGIACTSHGREGCTFPLSDTPGAEPEVTGEPPKCASARARKSMRNGNTVCAAISRTRPRGPSRASPPSPRTQFSRGAAAHATSERGFAPAERVRLGL